MGTVKRLIIFTCLLCACVAFTPKSTMAQERLCDNAFEDCRQALWDLIDAEKTGIDVAFWFMQDTSYAKKLISRFQAGVPVRVIIQPDAMTQFTADADIVNQLQQAGIPIRFKNGGGILHWKMMLFQGQGKVQFSGADYSSDFFVATTPNQNFIDEAIYFTDDPAVVNSFRTKYDELWIDTVNYSNFANIKGPLTRAYPVYPIDAELNFPPSLDNSQDFFNRTQQDINNENQKIDVIMYRITDTRYVDVVVQAAKRGLPVRVITEQTEYRERTRPFDAICVDSLYNAGIPIMIRAHDGLIHEKAVVLYSQGMTIFGSSNWSGPSSNFQAEHNYFTTKKWFFDWFVNQFNTKWNSPNLTMPFTPLPPDAPVNQWPQNSSTDQPTNMTLVWEGGPFAPKFDIYFGTDPNPPLFAADQFIGTVDDTTFETFKLPTLAPNTTYYWRIVGKTLANQTANGRIFSFKTLAANQTSAAPTVAAVSPNQGNPASGGPITISGTGFVPGAIVTIGGIPANNVTVVNSTTITAVAPATSVGTFDVQVVNPDGQSGLMAQAYSVGVAATIIFGDMNGDGVVDASDLVLLSNYLAGNTDLANPAAADVFQDGRVDSSDLVTLANYLAGNISSLPVIQRVTAVVQPGSVTDGAIKSGPSLQRSLPPGNTATQQGPVQSGAPAQPSNPTRTGTVVGRTAHLQTGRRGPN